MATIISTSNRFAFVHIPKCAGMSVTLGIEAALEGSRGRDMRLPGSIVKHPIIGRVMPAHKPLQMLADHFPEELAAYQACDCFAVSRDPRKRFASAVQQHLRQFHDRPLADMSESEIGRTIDTIRAAITADPIYPGVEYVHFLRQSDFVFLDGEKITEHVYPLEQLDKMAAHIAQLLSRPVSFDEQTNVSIPKTSAYAVIARIGRATQGLLPEEFYRSIKQRMRSALGSNAAKKPDLPLIFRSKELTDFIDDFYAADWALYRAGLARQVAAA